MNNASADGPAPAKVSGPVLGLDVGTECVKAVMLDAEGAIIARTSVLTQGYFESCIEQATKAVLEEAKVERGDLAEVVATGFGARCVSGATRTASDTLAHATGAHIHHPGAMTVLDIGGRTPGRRAENGAHVVSGRSGRRRPRRGTHRTGRRPRAYR